MQALQGFWLCEASLRSGYVALSRAVSADSEHVGNTSCDPKKGSPDGASVLAAVPWTGLRTDRGSVAVESGHRALDRPSREHVGNPPTSKFCAGSPDAPRRSVTTLNPSRRTQRHRSRDPITRIGCSNPSRPALLRSRTPTALKPRPKPRATTRLPHNALPPLAGSTRRRSLTVHSLSLLFCSSEPSSVTTSVRHLSHRHSRPHPIHTVIRPTRPVRASAIDVSGGARQSSGGRRRALRLARRRQAI